MKTTEAVRAPIRSEGRAWSYPGVGLREVQAEAFFVGRQVGTLGYNARVCRFLAGTPPSSPASPSVRGRKAQDPAGGIWRSSEPKAYPAPCGAGRKRRGKVRAGSDVRPAPGKPHDDRILKLVGFTGWACVNGGDEGRVGSRSCRSSHSLSLASASQNRGGRVSALTRPPPGLSPHFPPSLLSLVFPTAKMAGQISEVASHQSDPSPKAFLSELC